MKASGPTRATSRRPDRAQLRELWQQAQHEQSPGERGAAVLGRLESKFESKYQAIAAAASAPK